MAKRDNAIKDIIELDELEAIIKKCKICRVGMVEGDIPYVLAMNFGYEDQAIWLHCAKEGKKIDILKHNNKVCIEFDTDHKLFARHEDVACSWRFAYRSVLINGHALFVDDYDEKIKGLNIFMRNYSNKPFEFSKPSVDNVQIIKIPIESITGRSFEY
jgi:uncharacterized protein